MAVLKTVTSPRRAKHGRRAFAASVLAVILLTLFPLAVALADEPTANPPERSLDPPLLTHVTLQLKWHHQFQFAGYYAAIEKGFYRDAGLSVTLVEGGLGKKIVDEVLEGRSQYGVSNAETLLYRLQGKPLVALAAIFQHSPLAILAKSGSGISNPQDLVGRSVMMPTDSRVAELLAMFAGEGIGLPQIDPIEGGASVTDYLNPGIDAISAYLTNQPYYLTKNDIPFSVIRPATYGIDFYGDCLFTTEKEIEENPERTAAFRTASLLGWEYAMAHPAEMVDLIRDKYGSKKDRDHLLFEASAIRELMLPGLVEIGHMNPGRWRHMADTFVRLKMAEPVKSLGRFIYTPDPPYDMARVRLVVGITLMAALFTAAIGVALLIFNRRLRSEIRERKRAEREVQEMNRELEDRVSRRTAELMETAGALADTRERVRETEEKLILAEKMETLGDVVATSTHEINTPLGIGMTTASYLGDITNRIEKRYNEGKMARSDFENYLEASVESADIILTNIRQSADLIRSLKVLAVDQCAEERRAFKLREYIEKIIFSLKPKFKGSRHTIGVDCPEALELWSYPGAFFQILSNLVMNSLIHGFEGKEDGAITITARASETSVIITYHDNGRGIAEENIGRLFDSYFTTRRHEGGSGLGTHIIHRLVTDTLAGRIQCESRPGCGATFVITLPAGAPEPLF